MFVGPVTYVRSVTNISEKGHEHRFLLEGSSAVDFFEPKVAQLQAESCAASDRKLRSVE